MQGYIDVNESRKCLLDCAARELRLDHIADARAFKRASEIVRTFPKADVAPVIHAKWEKIARTAHYVDGIGIDLETGKPCLNKKEYNYDEYRCPVCRKFAKGDYLRFCDYCGARFDEMFDEETDDTEVH